MTDNFADQMKKAVSRDAFSGKKLTGLLVFGAIVVVFVFYGFASHHVGAGGNVAEVNNTIITVADLKREEQRVQQMYARMFGNAMDFSSQRQLLTQEAVQSLVNAELVSQAAQNEGLAATDQEVVNFIVKDYTVFQVNGVFQRDLYYRFLEANGFQPADFEALIRKDIENQRSRAAFEWASSSNKLEKEKDLKLKETQVILSYITVNPRDLETQIKFTEAEVQKALNAEEAFAKRVEDEFKARKSQFDQKEQVKAQHILVRFTAGDTKSEKAALDKINSLKAQSEKVDFGTLAEKNSEDPGSKAKKGDLGFFARGQMVPEFEEKAFKMKIGEISAPFKSQFGYHILKLNDKKAAKEAAFADHKTEISQMLMARDLINKEKNRAQEAFDKGEEKAWMGALKLSWKEARFDLSSDRIQGLSDKVLEALSDIMTDTQKVKVVQDGDMTYIVKLKEIKKLSSAPTKENVADAATRIKANDAFANWVQKFRNSSRVEINPTVLAQ